MDMFDPRTLRLKPMYSDILCRSVRRNYNDAPVTCRPLTQAEITAYRFAQNKVVDYFLLMSADGRRYKLFCLQPTNDFIREIIGL
jgi:hypothetical protein